MLVLSNSSFAFFKHLLDIFVYHAKKIKKNTVSKCMQMEKKKKYNNCHMFPPLMHLAIMKNGLEVV